MARARSAAWRTRDRGPPGSHLTRARSVGTHALMRARGQPARQCSPRGGDLDVTLLDGDRMRVIGMLGKPGGVRAKPFRGVAPAVLTRDCIAAVPTRWWPRNVAAGHEGLALCVTQAPLEGRTQTRAEKACGSVHENTVPPWQLLNNVVCVRSQRCADARRRGREARDRRPQWQRASAPFRRPWGPKAAADPDRTGRENRPPPCFQRGLGRRREDQKP